MIVNHTFVDRVKFPTSVAIILIEYIEKTKICILYVNLSTQLGKEWMEFLMKRRHIAFKLSDIFRRRLYDKQFCATTAKRLLRNNDKRDHYYKLITSHGKFYNQHSQICQSANLTK